MGDGNHYEALLDEAHKEKIATLTPHAWHLVVWKRETEKLYKLRHEGTGETLKERILNYLKKNHPASEIVVGALELSPTIDGELRHDTRDVMIGAKPQSQGLSVNVQNGAVGEVKNGDKPAVEARAKTRGFG